MIYGQTLLYTLHVHLFHTMLFKQEHCQAIMAFPHDRKCFFFFQKSIELACLFFYIKVNLHIQDQIT